jgi:hypothetical protein
MAAVTFIVGYKDKKKDEEDTSKKGRLRGPMLAIAGAGIWGVGFELLARATPYLGLAVSTLLYLGSAFVSAWLILLVAQLLGRLPATPTLTDAFKDKAPRMAGAILAVGYVAEIIGFEAERLTHTGGVITITIASCCSGIIAYLAIKRGGEKFEAGKMPWVIGGVAILIAGVALLLV